MKDEVSLILGLVSVISWGVAEVPQIITNCRQKSAEGLSIAFLMTWVVGFSGLMQEAITSRFSKGFSSTVGDEEEGVSIFLFLDLFNLFGCKLESDTVPLIWVRRVNEAEAGFTNKKNDGNVVGQQCNSDSNEMNGSGVVEEGLPHTSSPIPVAAKANRILSAEKDLYYIQMDAKGKFTENVYDATMAGDNSSLESLDEVYFCGIINPIHAGLLVRKDGQSRYGSDGVSLMLVASGGSSVGTILGWAMAAIYMGGRLPQICLNVKRGHVEVISKEKGKAMNSFSAEDVSKIGGIATVALLHSFIPTHWLPFSIVGRTQQWTLSKTLLVTAFGAVLHVFSTSLLGVTAITMANTIASEETVHRLASLLLVVLGGSYVMLFLLGKGGHSHAHNHRMEKMAVAGLVLVPALSPCATTLPVFLTVGNSFYMLVLSIVVLLFSTITVMTSLVALSYYGASQIKFHWVERYDKLLVGTVLCLVGILTFVFHDHDHDHAGHSGGEHVHRKIISLSRSCLSERCSSN
ncbi:hypothetical protein ACLOJK_024949 [Asimina triloba]